MMENMGWENGTLWGAATSGILNPPHIDTTPKMIFMAWDTPLLRLRLNRDGTSTNSRKTTFLQSAIEDYMLSNGPNITDEEKALAEDINGMDQLTAEIGDRDSALIGIDQDDMENFEDMCNMKEAFHWLLAMILKMEVSTGSILLTRLVQMVSFRWVGDGSLISPTYQLWDKGR